jgi:hypothetical protein
MKRSDDTIFLLDSDGDLQRVPRHHYESEDLLQRLIEKYPEVLAGDQMGGDAIVRFIIVKREAGIPDGEGNSNRWAVDHLLLDQNAVPTLVEVKRSSDTRIRREVVGQLLEYAANVDLYWPSDAIRALAVEEYGGSEAVEQELSILLGLNQEDNNTDSIEAYWAEVEENLRNGKMRILFVADELPGEVRRIIEFLNAKMMDVEVLGVELRQYVGKNLRAMVPRVIGQTEATKRSKAYKPSKKTNRDEMLSKCDAGIRRFISEVLDEADHRDLVIYWGVKGCSIRAPDKEGRLNTILYFYPPGPDNLSAARFESYFDNALRNTENEKILSKKYLDIKGVKKQGNFTYSLSLTPENMESAKALVEIVWDVPSLIQKL